MPVLNFGQPVDGIIQTAFIVPDIAAGMATYGRLLGIGPWFLFEHFELLDLTYRGRPSSVDITLALAGNGSMIFELIEQLDDGPSVYRDVLDARGYGFHHYAVSAPDFDAAVGRYEAMGYEKALAGRVSIGARAAYMDTTKDIGGMIEVIEMTADVEALFTHIQQASVGWDGRDAVRTFGPAGDAKGH